MIGLETLIYFLFLTKMYRLAEHRHKNGILQISIFLMKLFVLKQQILNLTKLILQKNTTTMMAKGIALSAPLLKDCVLVLKNI